MVIGSGGGGEGSFRSIRAWRGVMTDDPDIPTDLDNQASAFLKACLCFDRKNRLRTDQLLKMPFLLTRRPGQPMIPPRFCVIVNKVYVSFQWRRKLSAK